MKQIALKHITFVVKLTTTVLHLTSLQDYWVQLSGSSAPAVAWAAIHWRGNWAEKVKIHTHDQQLMPDVSRELSWDCQMVHQHVASPCGLDFSQHGSWVLRGYSPRGKKHKLPVLLKTGFGSGTGLFPLHPIGQIVTVPAEIQGKGR